MENLDNSFRGLIQVFLHKERRKDFDEQTNEANWFL